MANYALVADQMKLIQLNKKYENSERNNFRLEETNTTKTSFSLQQLLRLTKPFTNIICSRTNKQTNTHIWICDIYILCTNKSQEVTCH